MRNKKEPREIVEDTSGAYRRQMNKLREQKYRRNSDRIKINKTVELFEVVSKWKTMKTAEKCQQFRELQLDSEKRMFYKADSYIHGAGEGIHLDVRNYNNLPVGLDIYAEGFLYNMRPPKEYKISDYVFRVSDDRFLWPIMNWFEGCLPGSLCNAPMSDKFNQYISVPGKSKRLKQHTSEYFTFVSSQVKQDMTVSNCSLHTHRKGCKLQTRKTIYAKAPEILVPYSTSGPVARYSNGDQIPAPKLDMPDDFTMPGLVCYGYRPCPLPDVLKQHCPPCYAPIVKDPCDLDEANDESSSTTSDHVMASSDSGDVELTRRRSRTITSKLPYGLRSKRRRQKE